MIQFPTYVQIVDGTYRESNVADLITSNFERGPQKVRVATCTVPKIVTFDGIVCSEDYCRLIDDWWKIQINRGSYFFSYNDPKYAPAQCKRARLLNDELSGEPQNAQFSMWLVKFRLEVFDA